MNAVSITDTVVTHLVERGLISDDTDVTVSALTGGVSNEVLAVTGPGVDLVVKRALGQLRTSELWEADTARLLTEGRALRAARAIHPKSAPAVVDLTPQFLVIERAPIQWKTWKEALLDGVIDVGVAARLGEFLATLQRDSASGAIPTTDFSSRLAFEQLRVDPFHRQIAERHPDLRPVIDQTIDVMASSKSCLVHGDYTPKNIMVGESPDDVWVIDWEVAHVGDPTFDPAWIIGHLLLKSVHRPDMARAYCNAAATFVDSHSGVDDAPNLDHDQLIRQLGCLLLARVDGRSPVEYLSRPAQHVVRQLGREVLQTPPDTILDIWKALHD